VIDAWTARFRVFVLLGLFLCAGVGCSLDSDETVIRLGHALSPSHPVHKAMTDMADRVGKKSDGTMRIEIYPSEQLGSERELLELLQVGSLDITKVSSAVMEGFSDPYKVFGLPYLFRSDAHRYAVMDGEILSLDGKALRGSYDRDGEVLETSGTPQSRCIWLARGPRSSAWFWPRRRSKTRPTRSPFFPICWRLRAAW